MASASKPRKFGFSGILRGYGLTAPTIAASATVPASTRLQALPPTPSTSSLKTVPHEDHEVELITPAVIPDSTRKRVRDEEADNERPTKQARLDSSITSRIARSQAVMRSIPKMPRAGSLAAHTQKKATISQRLQQVRRTSSTRTTVAPAAPGTPHAGPVIYPHNTTYAKARDCDGWPRDKVETSDHGSETVQKSAAGQGADLQCQRALNAEEESTTPSAATPTEAPRLIAMEAEIRELKMALEREREATRSKSAQVLRLIESNTEQKNETGRAIEGLTARVQEGFLALKEKSDECVTLKQQNGSISASKDQQIKLLRDQIQQLQGENADVSSRKGDLEAQVNRLNSCNDYLQVSIKNAADAEFKIAARNSDLLVQLRDAKEQKDEAEQARDAALTDIANAKSRATAFKGMSRALATALSTLRADIIGVHEYLSADCDMDSEAKDDTAWQPDYRNYVKLPPIAASLPPSDHQSGPKKALSLFGRSEPDPTSPASFELLGSFAKPSLEYTGSFGMPSLAGANQHHQAKTSSTEELNEVQRTLREFSRELQATKQQSNELSTWIAKKEIGEHAPPPPNEKQRAFEQYVDSLVADKVHNGMSFSSGEPARAFSSDADVGMDEAPPSGPRATTSTYVDFASAPTFGPDGWPMQTDDHAYHKSVSRHNTTTFSTERKAKGKGKQSGDHESAKQSAWRYDNSAGKRQGLDISMGHNDAPDHSKEEQIFNRNSGKKGQRDGDQHVSQNKRGGKHDNSRGKSDSKGKRGGSANRGGKGGNGDFSHDSVNNSGRGRGDGGFRGGRGGRGRGRGGRGGRGGSSLEEDATAGAADPMDLTSSENTDASAGQTEDPELMESNTPMMLGRYQTNLTVEQTADMSRQWDEEHAGEAEGAAVLTGASLDAHEVDDDRSDEQLNNDDLAVDIPTRSRSYGTGSHGNRLMGNLDHRRSTPRYQDRPMPYAQAPTFMPVSRDPRLRPPPPGDFPTRDRIGAANAYRPAPYHARSSGAGPNEANAYGPGPHHARQDGNRANVTLAQQATPFAQKQHHGNRFEHKPEETSSQKAGLRRSLDEIIAEGKAPRDEKRGPFDPYANERAANSKHRQTRKSGRR